MPPLGEDNAEALLGILYAQGPANFQVVPYAAAVTALDPSICSFQQITLTGPLTLTLPPVRPGAEFTLELVQDATGSRVLTMAGAPPSKFVGASKTLTITANAIDVIEFECVDGVTWLGNLLKGFA